MEISKDNLAVIVSW